jgi:flagellar basal-body rod protein FlgB
MDAGQTDLLGLAANRLNWLDDRQKVLARNIANSDTPNFTPRDEMSFDKTLAAQGGGLAILQTDSMHLSGTVSTGNTVAMKPRQRSIDGNAVALDEQLTKVADTDTQQRLVTNLYSKYMGMFATAIGKG